LRSRNKTVSFHYTLLSGLTMTAPSESDSSPVAPETPGENGVDPSGTAPNGNGQRSKRIRRIGLIALIVGAAYGIYAYTDYRLYGRFIQETDDAYVKADGVTVSSKLSGYVRAVNFKDNQSVAAGTLLVQIDPTDYQTRLAQSDAQVQVARATQAASVASIAEARSAVGQASAAVDAASASLPISTAKLPVSVRLSPAARNRSRRWTSSSRTAIRRRPILLPSRPRLPRRVTRSAPSRRRRTSPPPRSKLPSPSARPPTTTWPRRASSPLLPAASAIPRSGSASTSSPVSAC
jgi:hypothetical protein